MGATPEQQARHERAMAIFNSINNNENNDSLEIQEKLKSLDEEIKSAKDKVFKMY